MILQSKALENLVRTAVACLPESRDTICQLLQLTILSTDTLGKDKSGSASFFHILR